MHKETESMPPFLLFSDKLRSLLYVRNVADRCIDHTIHVSLERKKAWGRGRADFPFVGWCVINTVSKNHIQTHKIDRGIAKQRLYQHLSWPSGKWVNILSSNTSTYRIHVVFQFNPTLPLEQQLALLLPGASECQAQLVLL